MSQHQQVYSDDLTFDQITELLAAEEDLGFSDQPTYDQYQPPPPAPQLRYAFQSNSGPSYNTGADWDMGEIEQRGGSRPFHPMFTFDTEELVSMFQSPSMRSLLLHQSSDLLPALHSSLCVPIPVSVPHHPNHDLLLPSPRSRSPTTGTRTDVRMNISNQQVGCQSSNQVLEATTTA
jgi:hypothetical protein